jgi:hypothetical protein
MIKPLSVILTVLALLPSAVGARTVASKVCYYKQGKPVLCQKAPEYTKPDKSGNCGRMANGTPLKARNGRCPLG